MFSAFPLDYLVAATVTLVVVMDPFGLVPIFLAVTQSIPKAARQQVALRAAVLAAIILAGAALIGDWLLRALSISLPAFRIAGGLLLFSIASEMVFGVRIRRQSEDAEKAIDEEVRNISAFPLAIPLMAGPGAITATVLLSGRAASEPMLLALLLGVIVLVCLLCFVLFIAAERIRTVMGGTANVVLERLLGVLLAALAVQFVVDGAKAIWG
ncbi:MAG: MarC family protein [Pseudolabrys sp.]